MKIRQFEPKDRRPVSELYYELHPVEEKGNIEKGLVAPLNKSKIKNILFVAEENKEVVGFVLGHLITYGLFEYGTIDEFFVRREFRSKGIGKKLIAAIMREFKSLNPKTVLVGTEIENKEAIDLYNKMGFEIGKRSIWFYWNPRKDLPK